RCFLLHRWRQPESTLFPYTTLFRSPRELSPPTQRRHAPAGDDCNGAALYAAARDHGRANLGPRRGGATIADEQGQGAAAKTRLRSEEHTSELQSQSNLVCRLLLEKK